MRPDVLFLHSPLVGPSSLAPLALTLAQGGWVARVPAPGGRAVPFWEGALGRVAATVVPGDPVVLVGHSGAGVALPALTRAVRGAGGRVVATAFVDAALPDETEPPAVLASRVDPLTGPDGWLPAWPEWWPVDVIEAELPGPALRHRVVADCPPVPRALLDERPPMPAGWPDHPVGYLAFTYEREPKVARAWGWPVRHLAAGHLAPAAQPAAVARALLHLFGDLGVEGGLVAPPARAGS